MSRALPYLLLNIIENRKPHLYKEAIRLIYDKDVDLNAEIETRFGNLTALEIVLYYDARLSKENSTASESESVFLCDMKRDIVFHLLNDPRRFKLPPKRPEYSIITLVLQTFQLYREEAVKVLISLGADVDSDDYPLELAFHRVEPKVCAALIVARATTRLSDSRISAYLTAGSRQNHLLEAARKNLLFARIEVLSLLSGLRFDDPRFTQVASADVLLRTFAGAGFFPAAIITDRINADKVLETNCVADCFQIQSVGNICYSFAKNILLYPSIDINGYALQNELNALQLLIKRSYAGYVSQFCNDTEIEQFIVIVKQLSTQTLDLDRRTRSSEFTALGLAIKFFNSSYLFTGVPLLKAGCSIEEPQKIGDDQYATPLCMACMNPHPTVVAALLAFGADIDSRIETDDSTLYAADIIQKTLGASDTPKKKNNAVSTLNLLAAVGATRAREVLQSLTIHIKQELLYYRPGTENQVIEKISIQIVRNRLFEIITALQELQISTLELYYIIKESVRSSRNFRFHVIWNMITTIRHFK